MLVYVVSFFGRKFGKLGKIIRSLLIHKIIQPIGKKEMAVAPPVETGFLRRIVIGKIILGYMRLQPFFQVPKIFFGKGFSIIFLMAGNKELTSVLFGD